MAKSQSIDYGVILLDLRAKREELDKVIKNLENLANLGLLNQHNPTTINSAESQSTQDISNLGVYEATAVLLKRKGSTMKTSDIRQHLIDEQVIGEHTTFGTVAATLYKAVRQKTHPKIRLVNKGEWGLAN